MEVHGCQGPAGPSLAPGVGRPCASVRAPDPSQGSCCAHLLGGTHLVVSLSPSLGPSRQMSPLVILALGVHSPGRGWRWYACLIQDESYKHLGPREVLPLPASARPAPGHHVIASWSILPLSHRENTGTYRHAVLLLYFSCRGRHTALRDCFRCRVY